MRECRLEIGNLTASKPPPRQPSGRVLASSVGGPGFNPQSRTASYQRQNNYGTSSSLVQLHSTLKRENTGSFSRIQMDKIWYRNPLKSEVIGHCGGDGKNNDHAELTKKSNAKKKWLAKNDTITITTWLVGNGRWRHG